MAVYMRGSNAWNKRNKQEKSRDIVWYLGLVSRRTLPCEYLRLQLIVIALRLYAKHEITVYCVLLRQKLWQTRGGQEGRGRGGISAARLPVGTL